MTRAADRHVPTAITRLLSVFAVGAFVATSARAGAVDPNQRFEHVGRSVADVAVFLPMPGYGRALVIGHSGDFHLTTGDRLVDDIVYHLPVSQTFTGDGVLDATWHNAAPGQILYVSYIQPTPRKLAVARFEFTGMAVTEMDVLYSVTIPPAANQNLGGGLTMAADGKLYLGVGDMGNSRGAQQPTTLQGKIFRLNSDLPGGIPSDNPISATSPIYATGVRNPVRMATDGAGVSYFLDVGPALNDELNIVTRQANYAWDRFTGVQQTTGLTDPIYVWSTAITPTGIAVNTGANFGAASANDLFVTGATGTLVKLHPNPTTPPPSLATQTVLYTAGPSEPANLAAIDFRADGLAYVSDVGGDIWRLKNNNAAMEEPSDYGSITPLLVRKTAGNMIEISAEREVALGDFGLYTGDVTASRLAGAGNWYTHGLTTTDTHPDDGVTMDAMSKFTIDGSTSPSVAYYLVSGLNTRGETGLGTDSAAVARPGGNQTFGCPCPAGATVGAEVDNCQKTFTLPAGVEGEPTPGVFNPIGPTSFFDPWDCDVVMMDMSMEWCNPCRAMAGDAEAIYQQYAGRSFMLVHVLPEDVSHNPAYLAVAQRWTHDFGLTFPVFYDTNYLVWGLYDNSGFIPQTMLFRKDGTIAQHWTGYQDVATITAAIDAELAR
jgi:hypothetical protein